jgi:hypothetical protein
LIPKGEKCGIKAIIGKYGREIVIKQGTRNSTNKPNTKFKILGEAKGETIDLGEAKFKIRWW